MEQNEEKKPNIPLWQKRQLALALAVTALLAVVVSSMAWLSHVRTLQTITRMQMPILFLPKDDDHKRSDIEQIKLGNLDFSGAGSKEIPFAVYATMSTNYILQVAYTTNLPLTYTIVPLYGQDQTTNILNPTHLDETHRWAYGDYGSENVQNNAEPVYQQTGSRPISREELQHFKLIVKWEAEEVSPKETDMVYLTVATANTVTTSNGTGGGA